ncbi:PREDICTED: BPI fold-containing family C protein, partial [Mesitornis unicolor]|uniref:BPI fold-containing family C protein n=1 Tax=Mesitornis unicolor TaxID=54374 RepID=UPI000528F3AF
PSDKGEKMLKTWYSFLLCWLALQLEANPGLKVMITQKGLDYGSVYYQCTSSIEAFKKVRILKARREGRRIGMELLKQAVLKETFPSWSGQESFSIVKVNYVISRLRINAVDFPETAASFIPGTGISLSVARASGTISADWKMKTWLLKDQGEITVSVSGLFIAIIFKVSRDSTGHLSTLLHNCQLSINSVKVKLNGGSSWIYNFLSGYLEKPIHTKLDTSLCLNIKYKIQMMDAELRKHKVLSQIDAFAQIDYSLVSSPAVFKSHITLDLKGDSMLYLGVSRYFLKSASLVYYRAGAFNITISKELATTFNLNTTLFKDSIPEMALSYIISCPVLLNITSCDSHYQSRFDSNQTEVEYLITSEENEFYSHYKLVWVYSPFLPKCIWWVEAQTFSLQFSLLHSALGSSEGHLVISTDVHYKHEEGGDEDHHSHS